MKFIFEDNYNSIWFIDVLGLYNLNYFQNVNCLLFLLHLYK